MMMTKHNTIDIYQRTEWPDVLHGVLLYSENEYGCASHIAMNSFVEDNEPDGRILTHLINQMVFNQSKDFEKVGWTYHFYNNHLIVNINKWPQTPIMPLDEAQATWIHCYPPVRDLLSFIKEKYDNLSLLAYVTSTTMHDALNTDIFAVHPPEHLMGYSHTTDSKITILPKHSSDRMKGDLFFSPPSWMFPHLAVGMGFTQAITIFSGHDPEAGDIDEVASLTLFRWLNTVMGNPKTKHAYNRSLKKTKKDVKATLDMRKDLEELLENAKNTDDAPNVLWG